MTKDKIKINKMFFSKRYGSYGMCIERKGFMAYMLFVDSEQHNCWYHCAELEEHYCDERGKPW